MTSTDSAWLADQVEIDLDTADVTELIAMLVAANEQRQSSSGRVWFLLASSAENAPCLAVGVRGDVGALEWIDDERLVPADGLNPDWITYYTVDLDDNAMPPRAELPLAEVLAVVEEFLRTRERPTTLAWQVSTS